MVSNRNKRVWGNWALEPRFCDFCGVLIVPVRSWNQRFCCYGCQKRFFVLKRKVDSGFGGSGLVGVERVVFWRLKNGLV